MFHAGKKFTSCGAVGFVLVGTQFELFFIVVFFGIQANVVLMAQAKGADNGERHLLHAQQDRHGGKVALKGKVHQSSMDDVILMMTKGNLGAMQFLGNVEKLFAAFPRAEEARGLLLGVWLGVSVKAGGDDVEGNTELVAEML